MEIKCRVPSSKELDKLNMYEVAAEKQLPLAIKRLYRVQGWNAKTLSRKISGVSENIWRQYGQNSYDRKRMIHVLAALSWASQTSMSAFYHGDNIGALWPGVDQQTISCITYSSTLPRASFQAWVRLVMEKNKVADHAVVSLIGDILAELDEYDNDDFMMPEALDIDDFKADYYQSVAVNFKRFRDTHNLSVETMAYVFQVPEERYLRMEDPSDAMSIPATIGLRLKLGFQLAETVDFVSEMNEYQGFFVARRIQEKRERIVIELMKVIPESSRLLTEQLSKDIAKYAEKLRLSF